ncbi:MAG: MFS transporter, partial [Chloroflexota bacterium]
MTPLAQRLTGGRFFYGWILVGVCGVSTFWGSGVTSDSFGVLLKPFSDELGIHRTEAVLGITIAAISGGFVSPILGPLLDRYGARLPLALSGAIAGLALILLSQIHAYWQFLLLFGVVLGACRPGIQMVAPGVVIANWFVRKRGR